jgi:hypothetical protein
MYVHDFILTHRTEYCETKDGAYGNQDETGTWGGVVGMVVRGEAHAGINILAFSVERMSSIAFLSPIWTSKYT